MPLSDVKIQKAKPRDEPFRMADGGGLYVLVNPAGSKLWRMDYRLLGKRRTLAVGAYPALSLVDAWGAGMRPRSTSPTAAIRSNKNRSHGWLRSPRPTIHSKRWSRIF